MKETLAALTFILFSMTSVFAKEAPPPSLEDEGAAFINNAGDESGDLNPDGKPPELDEPVTTTTTAAKPRTRPSQIQLGWCKISITMKCNGELLKDRQISLQMEGIGYSKNTDKSGVVTQSFPCEGGTQGKKVLLKFFEFKQEIPLNKVPREIDIPKGKCL